MELTKAQLKKIIKEELLNLAELGEVGSLTDQETETLKTLVAKASPAVLTALGLQKTEETA